MGVAEGPEVQLETFRQFALRLHDVAFRRSSGCGLILPFVRQLHGFTDITSFSLVRLHPASYEVGGLRRLPPPAYLSPELQSERMLSGVSCLTSLRCLRVVQNALCFSDVEGMESRHVRCRIGSLGALQHVSDVQCEIGFWGAWLGLSPKC